MWVKKGGEGLPRGIVDDRNGTISILSATVEMSGEYLCEIKGQNTTYSASALINVLHKVDVDYYITVVPQSLDLEEGKVGQLTCQIETPPGADEPGIIWLWNGSENLPYGTFDNRRGSLKFRDTKAEQSGTYTCQTDTKSLSKAEAIVRISSSKGMHLYHSLMNHCYSDALKAVLVHEKNQYTLKLHVQNQYRALDVWRCSCVLNICE